MAGVTAWVDYCCSLCSGRDAPIYLKSCVFLCRKCYTKWRRKMNIVPFVVKCLRCNAGVHLVEGSRGTLRRLCKTCKVQDNKTRSGRCRKKWKEAGRCAQCGQKRDRDGALCISCCEDSRERKLVG